MNTKLFYPLLLAAMISFTACDNPGFNPNQNYLPVIHSIVGMTPEKANEYLLKHGFVETNRYGYISRTTVNYIKANADSSMVYRLNVVSESDVSPISEYGVGLIIHENGSKTACQIYAEWSKYLYNLLVSNKYSIWSASVRDKESESYLPEINYFAGAIAPELKSILDANLQNGQISQEEYDYLAPMFNNKRSAFDKFLKTNAFVEGKDITEGFAHATGETEPGDGGVLDQKGKTGILLSYDYGKTADGMNEWFISFDYDNENWLSNVTGPFLGPISCK